MFSFRPVHELAFKVSELVACDAYSTRRILMSTAMMVIHVHDQFLDILASYCTVQ